MSSVIEKDIAAVVHAPEVTVSDKIRMLDRQGHPRAEIARLLGKRYQHVRNVLEGDLARSRNQPAATRPTFDEPSAGGPWRLAIRADNSVVLPGAVLESLGLRSGDVVIGRLEGGDLLLTGAATSARRARDRLRARLADTTGLSQSLIADRRREATRDADD